MIHSNLEAILLRAAPPESSQATGTLKGTRESQGRTGLSWVLSAMVVTRLSAFAKTHRSLHYKGWILPHLET